MSEGSSILRTPEFPDLHAVIGNLMYRMKIKEETRLCDVMTQISPCTGIL